MSRATLLTIRRLAAKTQPIIAEIEQRITELRKPCAVDHLLRIITVFRYGHPQIDEPLANAYCRALAKFEGSEYLAIKETVKSIYPEEILEATRKLNERSSFFERIQPKIFAQLPNIPPWLLWFFAAQYSTALLGIDVPRFQESRIKYSLTTQTHMRGLRCRLDAFTCATH